MKLKLFSLFALLAILVLPRGAFAATASISNAEVFDTSAITTGVVLRGANDPISNFIVQVAYGPNPYLLTGTVFTTVDPSGNFSVEFSGLQPQTKYYYQVRSVLGENLTAQRSFITKSSLLDLRFENVIETQATISGKVKAGSQAIHVVCRPSDEIGDSCGFSPTLNSDGTFSKDVQGLSAGTIYSVFVVLESNGGRISGMHTFRTKGVHIVPSASGIGTTTATISAQTVDGVKDIALRYGKNTAYLEWELNMDHVGTTFTKVISGLTADTNYAYMLKITMNDGTSFFTPAYAFRTLATDTNNPTVGTAGSIQDNNGNWTFGTGGTSAPVIDSFKGKLVPCSGVDEAGNQTCSFKDVVTLINNLINLLIFVVAPLIAVVVCLYAGFLILTSGGSEETLTKAKGMFTTALFGLIIAMGAWIIVKSILVAVGYDIRIFPSFY